MTGQLITSDHKTYTLPSLLRWEIVYTGSVPCDSYSVTFLYDASMAERLGFSVTLVDCGSQNLKITYKEDVILAEAIIASRQGDNGTKGVK